MKTDAFIKKYQGLVSRKLDDFLMASGRDVYDFALNCGLSYKVVEDVLYCWDCKTFDIITLSDISACIDAIEHGRIDRWKTN